MVIYIPFQGTAVAEEPAEEHEEVEDQHDRSHHCIFWVEVNITDNGWKFECLTQTLTGPDNRHGYWDCVVAEEQIPMGDPST